MAAPLFFEATRNWLWGPLTAIAGSVTWTCVYLAILIMRRRRWQSRLGAMAESADIVLEILADLLEIEFRDDAVALSETRRKTVIAQFGMRVARTRRRQENQEAAS